MAREAVFMVGLVALGALFALAVQIARLRTRVLGQERAGAELSRTVAAVQGWAAQELRALRDELTIARVDASAVVLLEQLEKAREASRVAAPSKLAAREPPAPSEKAPGVAVAALEEEEPTRLWTGADAARVRTEAEAGGAPRSPQATPRAALLVAVAPPASAPPFPSPEAGILAAGLGRPKSARDAPRPPTVSAAPTLVSMQAQGKVSAAPGRPPEPDDDEPRDTLAMLAPASPARRSSNEDGEETTFLEPVPQRT